MTATHAVTSAVTPGSRPRLPGTDRPLTGELQIAFGVRDERTYVTRQYHRGALTLLRPLYLGDGGEATLTVINPGGGYLRGDRYVVDIDVAAGAAAVVTTQSATRVYRTSGEHARQDTVLRLDDRACLTYAPDELIAFADAGYRQRTRAEVHPGATLFAKDVVTPGWSPDGVRFRYRIVHTTFDVTDPAGRLRVRDNLLLEPGMFGLLEDTGPLGEGATHVGSLLVVSPHVGTRTVAQIRDVIRAAESATAGSSVGSLRAGVSALSVPGALVRVLGSSTGAIDRLLGDVVDHLRAAWFDRAPLRLRKY